MFIPLNVNDRENVNRPRVLISGDTAMAFYLLGLVASLNVIIFMADTGISGTAPAGFRAGNGRRGPDRANVYYDFFDSPCGIGAGIVRRMDVALLASGDTPLAGWARAFRVPFAVLKKEPDGTSLLMEGATLPVPAGEKPSISSILKRFIDAASAGYSPASTLAFIGESGEVSISPGGYRDPGCLIIPEETPYSAWDDAEDPLKPGETLTLEGRKVAATQAEDRSGVRLIEMGVPELHVLKISGKEKERYIELTGDATRVFDGIL